MCNGFVISHRVQTEDPTKCVYPAGGRNVCFRVDSRLDSNPGELESKQTFAPVIWL